MRAIHTRHEHQIAHNSLAVSMNLIELLFASVNQSRPHDCLDRG